MRIASYNIRKAVGLDWRRDPDRIMAVLGEINADVVVLQEADKRIGQRHGVLCTQKIASDLGLMVCPVSVRPRSIGWHGNAVLYRGEGPEFGKAQRIPIPTIEPRGAVSARFVGPDIEVIGVHLALSRGMRLRQLAELGRHVENASHPVLVAGDFNAWRVDPHLAGLLGSEFRQLLPGASFHAARALGCLDRFMLKGDVRVRACCVHRSDLARRASDHLPIYIDLDI